MSFYIPTDEEFAAYGGSREEHIAMMLKAENCSSDYDAIPQALRPYPIFGFYTEGSKVPISAAQIRARWMDKTPDERAAIGYATFSRPEVLVDYATLLDTSKLSKPRFIRGPTMVVNKWRGGFVCGDLDPIERNLHSVKITEDEKPAYVAKCEAANARIIAWVQSLGGWMERSSSGKGVHFIIRGALPHESYKIMHFGDIYTHNRNFHLTGRLYDPNGPRDVPPHDPRVADGVAKFVDEGVFIGLSSDTVAIFGTDAETIERYGRKLDLTDPQVITCLMYEHPQSHAFLINRPNVAFNWSEATYQIIGDLDKITGDAAQVKRILFASEWMAAPGKDRKRRCRIAKMQATFEYQLADVRPINDEKLQQWYLITDHNHRLKRTPENEAHMLRLGRSVTPAPKPARNLGAQAIAICNDLIERCRIAHGADEAFALLKSIDIVLINHRTQGLSVAAGSPFAASSWLLDFVGSRIDGEEAARATGGRAARVRMPADKVAAIEARLIAQDHSTTETEAA